MKTIKKEQLVEMARVSKYDIYDVYVHTDDSGKIPHFRIWDDNTRGQKFHTCIRLDKLAYFHHTGKEDKLNNKEIKKLVQFLEASPADKLFDSYWQLLVHMWNINNSDIIVDTNIKMPDYSLLNK